MLPLNILSCVFPYLNCYEYQLQAMCRYSLCAWCHISNKKEDTINRKLRFKKKNLRMSVNYHLWHLGVWKHFNLFQMNTWDPWISFLIVLLNCLITFWQSVSTGENSFAYWCGSSCRVADVFKLCNEAVRQSLFQRFSI